MDTDIIQSIEKNQMELIPIEINKEIIASLGGEMAPLFSQIRIYGTIEDPLFVAKDVQTLLGLKNMHYKEDDGFLKWDLHKIKTKVNTGAGRRDAIVLTEQGLYKALYHSTVQIAEQFQTFVFVVMKRLRLTGAVTIEDAIKDLKEELRQKNARMKAFEMQWEFEHKELMRLRESDEIKAMTLYSRDEQVYKLKTKLKNIREPSSAELTDRIARLEQRYMRPILVMLGEPPREHRDAHDYDITLIDEFDEDMVDSTDVMIYSIGVTALKSKVTITKLYVHRDVKLDEFHRQLDKFKLVKEIGGTYQNQYEISLDMLRTIKDDINKEHESSF